jgi:peptidoglycan hydrolase-like protein with peptidoglycan-binding domain
MVRVMASSEDAQLSAMAVFIRAEGLHRPLQQHEWATFAAGYNGPDFAANEYDGKLANAYAFCRDNGPPSLRVRTAQLQLVYRSFDPGSVDGDLGVRTRAALRQFQTQKGLAVTGDLDDSTFAALAGA